MSASWAPPLGAGVSPQKKRSSAILRAALICLALLFGSVAGAEESVCYGAASQGRLQNGVRLPSRGKNFRAYSSAASLAGRTYVHSKVRDVVVAAYKALESSAAGKVFVYGETGWPSGGRFRPHKTHQNGLSVDFMVPVLENGQSVPLPTSVFNKLGYGIEFDAHGRYDDYVIDYEAMAAHLVELHRATRTRGIRLGRVIFDPELQPYLFNTAPGGYLQQHLAFSRNPSWVRHDEHYHVDFVVPCKPLGG